MDINLSISPAPGITSNYLVVAIYEATAPNTVVASQPYAAPHTSPRNLTFTNLNNVPHLVLVYENSTSSVGGTIRHSFIYQPFFKSVGVRDDLFITAGMTPGFPVGATSYTSATLIGWKYDVERRGFGTMKPTDEVSFDDTTGNWALVQTGDVALDGEVFVLRFQPNILTAAPPVSQSAGVLFGAEVLITDDVALDATAMGKMHLIQGDSDYLTITLPDLNAAPELKLIGFISEGGAHINALIKAAGSGTIRWLGGVAEVCIGQSEQIMFYKKAGEWRVMNADGNFKTVGEIVHQYDKEEVNTVFANGALLSRATNKRLFNFISEKLDPTEVVSETDWQNDSLNKKGKYSWGDGTTTFRVPLLYSTGYLRGVNGSSRKPGDFQDDDIKQHNHALSTTNTLPTNNDTADPVRGGIPGTANTKGGLGSGKSIGLTGGETTPKNYGVYLLIRS